MRQRTNATKRQAKEMGVRDAVRPAGLGELSRTKHETDQQKKWRECRLYHCMRALLHTAWSTTLRGDGARRQMGRGLTLELRARAVFRVECAHFGLECGDFSLQRGVLRRQIVWEGGCK